MDRPTVARVLLTLTLHADDRECVLADLDEEFESRRARYGDAAAQRRYRDQVWRSLAPALDRRWRGGARRVEMDSRFGRPHPESPQGAGTMDSLMQDLRFALPTLRKSPGFAVVAVLTLALGIGSNAAIFGAVKTVLMRPLGIQNPDRVVMPWPRHLS